MRRSASFLVGAIVFAEACATLAIATQAAESDRMEATLVQCGACHGDAGLPKDSTVPIIWGQKAEYLAKQLKDYRSGELDNQIMSSMAEAVAFAEIARATELLAHRPWPKRTEETRAAPDVAESCKGCHGGDFMGGMSPEGIAPRLAGQFADYLDYEMGAFAREERANQKTMTSVMKALSPSERMAMARYLAGL